MKKVLVVMGILSLSVLAYATVTPAKTDFVDYCTGANNSNCVYAIDSSGNVTDNNETVQGTLGVTGVATFTATPVFTGGATFSSAIGLQAGTSTQISVMTKPAGSLVWCTSTCAGGYGLCASTANAVASFVYAVSTGTVCK